LSRALHRFAAVHVEVGPVSSASVRAWVAFAREVLAGDARGEIADDVRTTFDELLREWDRLARKGPTFRWDADVPGEQVEYLVHGFFRIASRLADEAEARGRRIAPEEGDSFYAALVTGLLAALDSESAATAEFAAYLRSFWPGLGDEPG
jgi:hypothetical protein